MGTNIRTRYPGIRAFEENEQSLFFARRKEKTALLDAVKAKPIIVLFAKSGIGKSSLINAGLIPKLEDDSNSYFPVKIRLQETGDNAIETVKRALSQFIDKSKIRTIKEQDNQYITLWEYVKACTFPIFEAEGNVTPVLIFDQFEEFFHHKQKDQDEFARELADLINDRIPDYIRASLRKIDKEKRTEEDLSWHSPAKVKILIAIRSDRLGELDHLSNFIPLILENRFHLKPLNRDQAREAIIEPARVDGNFESDPFSFSEDSLNEILDKLSDKNKGEIESTYLQLICDKIEHLVIKRKKETKENNLLK